MANFRFNYISKLQGNKDFIMKFNEILESNNMEGIGNYITVKAKIIDIKYKILNVGFKLFFKYYI